MWLLISARLNFKLVINMLFAVNYGTYCKVIVANISISHTVAAVSAPQATCRPLYAQVGHPGLHDSYALSRAMIYTSIERRFISLRADPALRASLTVMPKGHISYHSPQCLLDGVSGGLSCASVSPLPHISCAKAGETKYYWCSQ